jgi:hypothetical protein
MSFSLIDGFVRAVLDHASVDDKVRSNVRARIRLSADSSLKKARNKLQNVLLHDTLHPIPHSHYYPDDVQIDRADAAKKYLRDSMAHAIAHEWNGRLHVSNTQVDLKRLCPSLRNKAVVDMTEQAYEESLEALKA